LIGIGS